MGLTDKPSDNERTLLDDIADAIHERVPEVNGCSWVERLDPEERLGDEGPENSLIEGGLLIPDPVSGGPEPWAFSVSSDGLLHVMFWNLGNLGVIWEEAGPQFDGLDFTEATDYVVRVLRAFVDQTAAEHEREQRGDVYVRFKGGMYMPGDTDVEHLREQFFALLSRGEDVTCTVRIIGP